jgi:hypothetical protein
MLACFEGIKQRASFEPAILSEKDQIYRELMQVIFSGGSEKEA